MNKNTKFLFLGLTLLILLVSISSINATNDINDNGISDTSINLQDTSNSNITSTIKSSNIKDTKAEISKPINKNKTIKTTSKDKQIKKTIDTTQTANDYETLKTSWNNIQENGDNTTQYTINLKDGNYNFKEELSSNITDLRHITINGNNVDKTIFDGENKTRFFNITSMNQIINFNNITFKNGLNDSLGGAIYTQSELNINNCNFIDNKVSTTTPSIYGGAIYVNNNLTVVNSTFINNKLIQEGYNGCYGGAIYFAQKDTLFTCNITYSNFINNSANGKRGRGGAIAIQAGSITAHITNCNFEGNYASYTYGGSDIALGSSSNKTVEYCVFNTSNKRYMDYNIVGKNYFINDKSGFTFIVNGKYASVFNQKTKKLDIKYIYEDKDKDEIINNLGLGYVINITSSSDLINTTKISLNPENNYTTSIDISKLPVNHENITLTSGNILIANIIYDHSNVEFNNITAKPGETITLNATFKTSDNKLIPNGKVAFKINGCTIGHSNIKYGTAKLNYTIPENYSAKDYILTTTYGGSSKFIEARTNSTLHLKKLATKTNLTTTIEGNILKITVDPRDEKGNTVKDGKICVKIEGKTLQNLKIKGKTTVNFTIPKSWNNREIKVLAIYGENNNHKESRTEIKTKLVLPNTKTTKTDEVINNYYVSDLTGSDTNTGSQTSPFKTIQKAISTVNTNKQNANIYLDGNFKGVGNTNLTVPGNLHINFIGVGNSSIDGEVNYTIKTILDPDEYYWLSSPIWYPYNNATGNWAMNITRGTGLIKITNLTIKNCWNPGESNFESYLTGTITNNGNLIVNNVSFIYNHGGVGAGIKNNAQGNLTVLNSLFEANRKSNSTGNYGAGIYNNGTATIINSIFQKNYARWGTITNDKNLTIINSTIRDNIEYDGGSTYKTGTGITANTQSTNFYANLTMDNVTTVVDRCTFINNDQLDIYLDQSNINITNCVFNNSTGIYIPKFKNDLAYYNISIINNTFNSPRGSSLFKSLSSLNEIQFALKAYAKAYYVIENNIVSNITGGETYAIEIKSDNVILENNTFNRVISVVGKNNTITRNNITTEEDIYGIVIGSSSLTNVTNNYISTKGFLGSAAISYDSLTTNIIENNTPQALLIQVDDDTFYRYFDDDGKLLNTFKNIIQIQINNPLTNKNIILDKDIQIIQTSNIISSNLTITINNAKANINGVKIVNTNKEPGIIFNSNENIVENVAITTNADNTIVLNGENNNITNNILIADILVGDESVKTTSTTNKIEDNTPNYKNYIITEKNYNEYFDNQGNMKPISDIREIYLLINGTIKSKQFIFNVDRTINIQNYQNAVLTNCTIKTLGNTKLNIKNITIINNNEKTPITINSPVINIEYTNITADTNAINIINVASASLNISYNNIFVNSSDNVASISIRNVTPTSANIGYNNITTFGPATNLNWVSGIVSTCSIELINTTGVTIQGNNIVTSYNSYKDEYDTIYSINMIGDKTGKVNTVSGNNINTNGYNYAYAINSNYQTIKTQHNQIITKGQSPAAIQVMGSNGNDLRDTITCNGSYAQGIILSMCNNTRASSSLIVLNGNTTIGFSLYQCNNCDFQANTIKLNGTNAEAFNIVSSENSNITNNKINTIARNITNDSADIKLINTKGMQISGSTISTLNKYTITLDKESSGNLIKTNTLYSNEYYAEDSIMDNGILNRIRLNYPENPTSFIVLNEKTYSEFFDKNGVLKDEIPSDITILISGNLYGKILNITRPLNLISEKTTLEDCIIIIDKKATNTNITGVTLIGENTKVKIYADNCTFNMDKLNITSTNNINPILILGNNNNILLSSGVIGGASENNATVITVEGDSNKINIDTLQSNYYNVIGVLLNNANNNYINMSKSSTFKPYHANEACGVMLNNSNYNIVDASIGCYSSNHMVNLKLNNSSYNQFSGSLRADIANAQLILVENNSNNNRFENINIPSYGTSSIRTIPIIINNSHNNTIRDCSMQTGNSGNLINIIEGVGNTIEYNTLITTTHGGNVAVLQENINDTVNNIVRYNVGKTVRLQISSNIVSSVDALSSVLFNVTFKYRPDRQYIPVEDGLVIFIVNGKEVGNVTLSSDDNGTALYNYTLTKDDVGSLDVKIRYVDLKAEKQLIILNKTIEINKFSTTTLMPNITNPKVEVNPKVMIMDSNGNIVYEGNVTFKLGNKTSTVSIVNGLAQTTFSLKDLDMGDYELIAEFNGNNIQESSNTTAILSVGKKDIVLDTKKINTYAGSKILINETLYDVYGNQVVGKNKVAIKYNGKTILKTTITDGKLCEYIEIPKTLKSINNTLEIVVGENSKYNTKRCNFTVDLYKQGALININKITAKPGDYITLKATFKTNMTNENITSGKVAFKINGITQKDVDENGVVNSEPLRISNGEAIIHLYIPKDMKSKTYNITVTYSGNNYIETARYTQEALTIKA